MSGEINGHRNRGLNIAKKKFMRSVWENGFGKCKTRMRGPGNLAKKVKTRFHKSKLSIYEAEDLVHDWMVAAYGEEYYKEALEKEKKLGKKRWKKKN